MTLLHSIVLVTKSVEDSGNCPSRVSLHAAHRQGPWHHDVQADGAAAPQGQSQLSQPCFRDSVARHSTQCTLFVILPENNFESLEHFRGILWKKYTQNQNLCYHLNTSNLITKLFFHPKHQKFWNLFRKKTCEKKHWILRVVEHALEGMACLTVEEDTKLPPRLHLGVLAELANDVQS